MSIVVMTPSLCTLPIEIVEHIASLLPHRDSLLHLRRTHPELAAKTTRCFAKAYFTHSNWTLNMRHVRILTNLSVNNDFALHMTTISLQGPLGKCSSYDNVILSKGLDGILLASILSRLSEMRTLSLAHFEFKGSVDFFRELIPRLVLQKLEALSLHYCFMNHKTLAALLRRHKRTLNNISLDNVDLDAKQTHCGHNTPWSTVLNAMQVIKNDCHVLIERPMEFGYSVMLSVSVEPDETFKGFSVISIQGDEDDEDMESWFQIYHIRKDSRWRDGVKYMKQCYEYNVYEGEGCLTPPYDMSGEE
jgi:hypothetical protein